MRIMFHLDQIEGKPEELTNFRVAEAVTELCDRDFNNNGLNAEVVAKMILLQIDARKGGAK